MKKLFLFLIIAIAGFGRAKAQDGWVNYKIDDKLSVKFPMQPTKLDENSIFIKDNDSSVYVLAVVDMAKSDGLDSATLASQGSTKEFTDSFKNGMLSEMPGSTLGDVSIAKWHNYTSYIMEGGNAAGKLKLYAFMVLAGTKMYALMTLIPENRSTKGKDYFFSSLTPN